MHDMKSAEYKFLIKGNRTQMRKSEFSEKFYEILVDHFLLRRGFNIYVPSQCKERKLGYDALINNLKKLKGHIQAFAFQYKIVEEYERRPANGDNFKFYLYPKNNYLQHNKLVHFNSSNKVFAGYVVPNFISFNDLYTNLNSGTLLANSLFIPPQAYITDNKSHYITFGNLTAHQHSRQQNDCKILPFTEIIEAVNLDFTISPMEFVDVIYSIEEINTEAKRNNSHEAFLIAYRIIK